MTRLAVIGAGLIGSRHVHTIKTHQSCELVAVIDPNPDSHIDPTVNYYVDTDQITEPIDAVVIATPTELHCQQGIDAARKGWHLLIEKPVSSTVADAEKLLSAVQESGVRCLVGHHRRYHDSIARLRHVISSGKIGRPITSTLIWAVRKPDNYFELNWRQTKGSPVLINLIHDIDLLRYVLGEITSICGFGSSQVRNTQRIESGAVALYFSSGCCGTISFADTAPSPWGFEAATGENPNIAASQEDMWWISGTEGGIAYPSLQVWTDACDWSQMPRSTQMVTNKTVPLNTQLDHFLSVISGECEPMIDIPDAIESLRVTLELEKMLTAN